MALRHCNPNNACTLLDLAATMTELAIPESLDVVPLEVHVDHGSADPSGPVLCALGVCKGTGFAYLARSPAGVSKRYDLLCEAETLLVQRLRAGGSLDTAIDAAIDAARAVLEKGEEGLSHHLEVTFGFLDPDDPPHLRWADPEWGDASTACSLCLLENLPFAVRLRLQDASSLQESLLLGDTLHGPGLRMVTNLAGTHPEVLRVPTHPGRRPVRWGPVRCRPVLCHPAAPGQEQQAGRKAVSLRPSPRQPPRQQPSCQPPRPHQLPRKLSHQLSHQLPRQPFCQPFCQLPASPCQPSCPPPRQSPRQPPRQSFCQPPRQPFRQPPRCPAAAAPPATLPAAPPAATPASCPPAASWPHCRQPPRVVL
ncbi:hypothetical protein PAPYR_9995 [Paratrimastix pyriformis]|uniref:Uncharacterized protein n=1 Tax=Paratrimastix pyriformis TaxID=342808 RepID=A0ABQ8U8M1_9EUKA|nr:hypothetical protein PAPYR_9995 [Paratrimastix pyriformis]